MMPKVRFWPLDSSPSKDPPATSGSFEASGIVMTSPSRKSWGQGVFNVSILRMYLVLLEKFGEKGKAKKIDPITEVNWSRYWGLVSTLDKALLIVET